MIKRVIILGSGRNLTLGIYTDAVKYAIQRPDVYFMWSLTGWGAYGRDIRQQFMDGVHDRINRHLDRKGRKYSEEYWKELRELSWRINGRIFTRKCDLNQFRNALSDMPLATRNKFLNRIHDDNE